MLILIAFYLRTLLTTFPKQALVFQISTPCLLSLLLCSRTACRLAALRTTSEAACIRPARSQLAEAASEEAAFPSSVEEVACPYIHLVQNQSAAVATLHTFVQVEAAAPPALRIVQSSFEQRCWKAGSRQSLMKQVVGVEAVLAAVVQAG